MDDAIEILHLEDDLFDAALVFSTLREGGIKCKITRCETEPSFVSELEKGGIALILADLKLPTFDGMSALTIAKTIRSDVPFIFVSGTLGEEQAVESLKKGATDYVLKNNLSKLPLAINEAMKEVTNRLEKIEFESRELFRKRLVIPPTKTTRNLPLNKG